MADHEDYLPGEAPAAHSATHEDGGADEINLFGLDGQSNELLAHSLIPTAHQDAPALIALHSAIEDAHHVRYTDAEVTAIADGLIDVHTAIVDAHHLRYTDAEAEAVADTQIATHTAIPTAHQDAPALILAHKGDPVAHQDAPALIATHKADVDAHHAKYTDAEAITAIYAALPAFHASINTAQLNVTGDATVFSLTGAFWTELLDHLGNFSNGTFTAPITGLYLLTGLVYITGLLATHTTGSLDVYTSNRAYTLYYENFAARISGDILFLSFSIIVDMDSTDIAYLNLTVFSGAKVVDVQPTTYFSGVLLQQ